MALNIGDLAPDFTLNGTDGEMHTLAEYADRPALAIIFSCNHCPYVQAYEDRMMALQQDLGSRGFQIVAINANETKNYPEDSYELMVERAAAREFNFDYLRDEDQKVAAAYGGERTPHIFLFDGERKLVYTGAIDDNWKEPEAVQRTYLRDAAEAVLAGQPVAEPTTHAIGCSIKWNA